MDSMACNLHGMRLIDCFCRMLSCSLSARKCFQISHCVAGADEGAFAWLTLNYLLGHLGQSEEKTVAAIDLGGGSVQQAFAISAQDATKAPPGYVTQLSGGGRTYNVYVHRWA